MLLLVLFLDARYVKKSYSTCVLACVGLMFELARYKDAKRRVVENIVLMAPSRKCASPDATHSY
jgi:hypothetical protein